tara:strand:+ start:1872 stop:2270 length:399 start_codon:yes stop_codon:yes gene_type:complete
MHDTDNPSAKSSKWWVIEGGQVREPNSDELQAREDAKELNRISNLESQTRSFQESRHLFACPANFYAIIVAAKIAGKVGPKVTKCLEDLQRLWNLYESAKADTTINVIDFSSIDTPISHSFDEVEAEISSLL